MVGYTEDHLIEQPAIQLMEHELGWDSVNAYEEPPSPSAFPKATADKRLRRSGWSTFSGTAAVEELTRDGSVLSLAKANRRIDMLLRGRVKVTIPERKRPGRGPARPDFHLSIDCPRT